VNVQLSDLVRAHEQPVRDAMDGLFAPVFTAEKGVGHKTAGKRSRSTVVPLSPVGRWGAQVD